MNQPQIIVLNMSRELQENTDMQFHDNLWNVKIFANQKSGDGLLSKIYKELMQLNSKKPHYQLKMEKGHKQTFVQRRLMNGHVTWIGAWHHLLEGKCKSKPQWDITSCLSSWLSSKTRDDDAGKDLPCDSIRNNHMINYTLGNTSKENNTTL